MFCLFADIKFELDCDIKRHDLLSVIRMDILVYTNNYKQIH